MPRKKPEVMPRKKPKVMPRKKPEVTVERLKTAITRKQWERMMAEVLSARYEFFEYRREVIRQIIDELGEKAEDYSGELSEWLEDELSLRVTGI